MLDHAPSAPVKSEGCSLNRAAFITRLETPIQLCPTPIYVRWFSFYLVRKRFFSRISNYVLSRAVPRYRWRCRSKAHLRQACLWLPPMRPEQKSGADAQTERHNPQKEHNGFAENLGLRTLQSKYSDKRAGEWGLWVCGGDT